ncbi:PR domain zinc finger protein 14 [Hydra vulgaris]|uniref:PR domain zinc finger protein 12 n=1 Tax=Hydra vulgaris TaxID=6087 RepID=T2M613_HYDVU|nr:PR domain zinc finger protein 14 [Hydra vulgaris]
MLKNCKVVLEKYALDHKTIEIPIIENFSSRIANNSAKTQKIFKKAHGNKIQALKKARFTEHTKKRVILMRKDKGVVAVVFKTDYNESDFNTVLNHLIQKYKVKEPEENVINAKLNDFTLKSLNYLNASHDQVGIDFSINSSLTPNNGNHSNNGKAGLEQKQTPNSVSKEKSSVCFSCNNCLSGKCKTHGNPMEKLKKTNAVLSLPSGMIIQESSIPNAGLGVFALSVFEAGSLFGKMVGEALNEKEYHARENKAYVWEVYNEENTKVLHYLDCQDEEKSDWMRFVNCARFEEEQNLIAEQYGDSIYYKAYKKINPGEELLVWYGNAYGNELREMFIPSIIPLSSPNTKNKISPSNENFQEISQTISDQKIIKKQNLKKLETPDNLDHVSGKNHRSEYRNSNSGVSKTFECPDCFLTFSDELYLQTHKRAFHSNIKSYSCSSCFRKFVRADNLYLHISAVHEKVSPLVCNICNRCFEQTGLLEQHLKLHCEKCGTPHNDASSLRKHIKHCHSVSDGDLSEDTFKVFCDGCDTTFTDIKRHFRVIHKRKIQSKCAVCGECYVNLGSHMAKHKIKLEPIED